VDELHRSWRRRAAATLTLARAREVVGDLEAAWTLHHEALQLDPRLAALDAEHNGPWHKRRVTGEIFGRIVYCGPRSSGKTASLRYLSSHTRPRKGRRTTSLVTFEGEERRTLLFDFLPLDLGNFAGRRVYVHLLTLPGEELGHAARQRLLAEALGVVFVADSRQEALADNRRTLDALQNDLVVAGLERDRFPLVLQYNRRDGARALPVSTLDLVLNEGGWPTVESVALRGPGVHATMRTVLKAALARWPLA
jgi:signal recognition particle receptor subunit beta